MTGETRITYPIKALGGDRLGGYLVLGGAPERKDLTGEYFTPETEEMDAIYKAIGKLPFLYGHAMDGALKSTVVGVIDVVARDEVGLWYEAQLDRSGKYKAAIQKLAQDGALGTSSGTLPGARKVAADGRIERWPIIEGSATTSPADPAQMERPIGEIKSHFAELGLAFPEANTPGDAESRAQVAKARLGLLALLAIDTL